MNIEMFLLFICALCVRMVTPEMRYLQSGRHCTSDEFFCHSETSCIPLEWRCDRFDDCSAGEDEDECETVYCPSTMFKCPSSGPCIHYSWFCDGAQDCPDGIDERKCP